jgi:hypothetical protein
VLVLPSEPGPPVLPTPPGVPLDPSFALNLNVVVMILSLLKVIFFGLERCPHYFWIKV